MNLTRLSYLSLGFFMAALQMAAAGASGGVPAAPDPLYVKECGSCHVPYPARLLPASSWQAILGGLDRHFNVDASVEPETLTGIRHYLESHARREPAPPPPAPALRISETRWFRHEHDEVPPHIWQTVKSPANCGACHQGAEQGRFSEHDIRLPKP